MQWVSLAFAVLAAGSSILFILLWGRAVVRCDELEATIRTLEADLATARRRDEHRQIRDGLSRAFPPPQAEVDLTDSPWMDEVGKKILAERGTVSGVVCIYPNDGSYTVKYDDPVSSESEVPT